MQTRRGNGISWISLGDHDHRSVRQFSHSHLFLPFSQFDSLFYCWFYREFFRFKHENNGKTNIGNGLIVFIVSMHSIWLFLCAIFIRFGDFLVIHRSFLWCLHWSLLLLRCHNTMVAMVRYIIITFNFVFSWLKIFKICLSSCSNEWNGT